MIPIGRLNQNTVRQPKAVRNPPRIGPRIMPAPTTIALIPSARPSSRRGKASVTSAAELAIRNAPPTPWRALARTRNAALGATAHRTEASVKIANPNVYERARPIMSAIRPALSTRTVITSVYPTTMSSIVNRSVCRSRMMSGSAITSVPEVRDASRAPRLVTESNHQR